MSKTELKKIEIMPGIGLEKIPFGSTADQIIDLLGEAEDEENLDDEEAGIKARSLNYWDLCLYFFLEDVDGKEILTGIQTDAKNVILFEKDVMKMNISQLKNLINKQEFEDLTETEESWGETRLSCDELNIDFYFENNKINTISWSAPEE